MRTIRALLIILLLSCPMVVAELLQVSIAGQSGYLEVDEEQTLAEIRSQLSIELGESAEGLFAFVERSVSTSSEATRPLRDYDSGVSATDAKDIAYIVTSLANRSLIWLASHRRQLEAVGDRIDPVHPLHFLRTVFSDERLKVGIRAVRKRGWVWDDFYNGLKESLDEEYVDGNLTEEMLADFAGALGIDPAPLHTVVHQRSWLRFVDLLIELLPRAPGGDRYDM